MRALALKPLVLLCCLGASASLSGCTLFWPEAGHGGFAEHRFGLSGSLAHDRVGSHRNNRLGTSHFTRHLQQDGYSKRGRVAEARHVHDFAIIAFDERIAHLKARGANRCAPGDLAIAEQLLIRVKRQWVSDLYGDALIDIERLEHRLDVVDQRVFLGECQRVKTRANASALSSRKKNSNAIATKELNSLK